MLEKPDVQAMYKMLWDTDDVEEEYVEIYGFSEYPKISKSNFIKISSKRRYLIQPALDYQARLRKSVGGSSMWEALTTYRIKAFAEQEDHSETLEEAVEAIILVARGYSRSRKALTSEKILQESQLRIEQDIEFAERELRLRERQKESEKRAQQSTAPDRRMHQAWSIFLSMKQAFAEEEYTTDDLFRRQQDRDELFRLYDAAKEESSAYYRWKDAHAVEVTEGTPADHEARYQDWLLTDEGKAWFELVRLLRVLEAMEVNAVEARSKKRRGKGKKTEKHLLIETHIKELDKT